VDCGPIIDSISVTPQDTLVNVDGIKSYKFKAWKYQNRSEREKYAVHIDCIFEVKENTSISMDKAGVYYLFDDNVKYSDEIIKDATGNRTIIKYRVIFLDINNNVIDSSNKELFFSNIEVISDSSKTAFNFKILLN